jgi:SAM-dependent methyltransferase
VNIQNCDELRTVERASIRDFVERHRQYLTGRVLDFGAGREPYKEFVTGEYVPYELGQEFPAGSFDNILCTQVYEYLPDPQQTTDSFSYHIKAGGHLVMTYPTAWYECEETDFWRFTKAGMERMLKRSGFEIVIHEPRERHDPLNLTFGYGVVAVRP